MTRDAIRQFMYDTLDTQFPAEYGAAVPVERENHKFTSPRNQPYMILWTKYSPTRKAAIGTTQGFIRHKGMFMIDIVVPDDTGTKELWDIASALERVFKARGFSLSDGSRGTLYTPSATGSGRPLDGYYTATVAVPFHVDSKEDV